LTRISICLVVFSCLLGQAGCGDEGGTASISAGLLVPRALSDELVEVTIYLFKTNTTDQPYCDDLTSDFDKWEDKAFDNTTVAFQSEGVTVAVIDGIPNRGRVWRFHARGYDGQGLLIAEACDVAVYLFEAGQERQITMTLEAI